MATPTKTTATEQHATPRASRNLLMGVGLVCAATFVLELFAHGHPHFSFDGFKGFYGVVGLVSTAAAIALAKLLGVVLRRTGGSDV